MSGGGSRRMGIMGETKIRTCGDVWALCDRLGIPHFEFQWDGMFAAARAIERLEEKLVEAQERAEKAEKLKQEWLRENGPGGWIDELRSDAKAKTAECECLRAEMLEAFGHVGAARVQSISSDDQIIMGHVREAERILAAAFKKRG
jgi:hypothetical protein